MEETAKRERKSMKELFQAMEDSLLAWATGSKDQLVLSGDMGPEDAMIRQWGERWLRVFRRKSAVEEAWFVEEEKENVEGEETDAAPDGMKVDEV